MGKGNVSPSVMDVKSLDYLQIVAVAEMVEQSSSDCKVHSLIPKPLVNILKSP